MKIDRRDEINYAWKIAAGHQLLSGRTAAWWTHRKCNKPRRLISPCTTPRLSRAPHPLQHLHRGIRTRAAPGTIPPGILDTIGTSGIRRALIVSAETTRLTVFHSLFTDRWCKEKNSLGSSSFNYLRESLSPSRRSILFYYSSATYFPPPFFKLPSSPPLVLLCDSSTSLPVVCLLQFSRFFRGVNSRLVFFFSFYNFNIILPRYSVFIL